MQPQIYTFAKINDPEARNLVYQEINKGKSRFGMWEQEDSLKRKWNGQNAFLLRIKKDDWIVHVNMPEYGQCVAAKVIGEYEFDEGLKCKWGRDFNNYIPIDPSSIIEFNRNDSNILPSVNLSPRRRAQRVLQVEDFLESLENLKNNHLSNVSKFDSSLIHLQKKVKTLLPEITPAIHKMNRSKDFERFLHRIFDKMPNTISIQNGFGWKTDYGADLIVDFENPIIGVNVRTRLIVQAKSYEGAHYDKHAIDQIIAGIEKFKGDAGLLITTATETEELEEYVREKSNELDKTIDVIAGPEVAKFVIRHAPEFLIGK